MEQQARQRILDELHSQSPHASFVRGKSIAVLLPCYNEAATIGRVVEQFHCALPGASIYVYDNNSSDGTFEAAASAGAIARRERQQGKGNVVRRMLADIEADIYVLADGDLTYDANAAGRLIDELVTQNLDIVVGVRVGEGEAYRRGHAFGNRMFNTLVKTLFGAGFTDVLSGYRVMSHRFAKSFPAASRGFEIESELTIHALDLRLPVGEIPLAYGARPENSKSKLNTYADGFKIAVKIMMMYKALKPFYFFGMIGVALFLLALALGAPVIITFFETRLVPRLPTAILAAAIAQLGFISVAVGGILQAVSELRRDLKRMHYLSFPSPNAAPSERKS